MVGKTDKVGIHEVFRPGRDSEDPIMNQSYRRN